LGGVYFPGVALFIYKQKLDIIALNDSVLLFFIYNSPLLDKFSGVIIKNVSI